MYPPAWILNGRRALEDVQLGGYTVPKGSTVFVSPYVMHHLPQYFDEPEAFKPERFTAEFEKSLPKFAYMPFGGGARVCIGNAFAMMEAQLILATIAQKYRLTLASRNRTGTLQNPNHPHGRKWDSDARAGKGNGRFPHPRTRFCLK